MIYFYYLLFIVAIFGYLRKKYVLFLVSVLGLMTKLFMLDLSADGNLPINGSELSLFLFLCLIPFAYIRNRNVFVIDRDQLTLWVYIFIGLYLSEMLLTVFFNWEGLINSFKVIRISLIMTSFFILKTIPLESLKKFLKLAFVITLIQGVLYLLQFAGINMISGLHEDRDLVLGLAESSAGNTPVLVYFFIYFVLEAKFLHKYRIILFAFFISLVLLSFIRGRIISVLAGLFYWAFVGAERKRRFIVVIIFLIVTPIANYIVNQKSEIRSDEGGVNEIISVIKNPSNLVNSNNISGTFTFRMAMWTERVVWLIDNPEYLLTGVGTMHEDSPKTLTMFNFQLGTRNEGRFYGRTIIESGDITWVPITLRYGLLGLFIHIMMFIILFNYSRNRKDILKVFAAYAVCRFVGTFDGPFFEYAINLFQISLLYAMISRANSEKSELKM